MEQEYSVKLQQAKLEENYDKIACLLWEYHTLLRSARLRQKKIKSNNRNGKKRHSKKDNE